MPFTVINGTFHVVNFSPDGDSIRFKAVDTTLWSVLGGGVKLNASGAAQLRIEAIDSLETHYTPPGQGGTYHQPLGLAHQSADFLLSYLKIGNVKWNAAHTVVVSASDGTPGYILSREPDKYGRPISFVFAGASPWSDGGSVTLSVEGLKGSYNFQALEAGLAYATYYHGLFSDLRDELTKAVTGARAGKRGIYASEVGTSPFTISSIADLSEKYVLMPKLFRRMAEYIANTDSIEGFKEAMAQAAEPVLDLTKQNFTHFDTFIDQATGSNTLAMTRLPEQLIFDPMPQLPTNAFSLTMLRAAERSTTAVAASTAG